MQCSYSTHLWNSALVRGNLSHGYYLDKGVECEESDGTSSSLGIQQKQIIIYVFYPLSMLPVPSVSSKFLMHRSSRQFFSASINTISIRV